MAEDEAGDVVVGEGYAITTLDAMGEGPGFRKVRRELGVTAFGVNVIVLPEGYDAGTHYHDQQEELYLVLRGTIEIEFGDGSKHELGPGGIARVDAPTIRKIKNVSDGDAVYVITGGKDGYVGRDGQLPEGEERVAQG
jgi:mannose-6-phosphate isomerase-like protein (cupin superfamily)